MSPEQFTEFMMMLEAIRLAITGNGQALLITDGYQFRQDASAASDLLADDVLGRVGALGMVAAVARPAKPAP